MQLQDINNGKNSTPIKQQRGHQRSASPHEIYLKNDDGSGSEGEFYDNNFGQDHGSSTIPTIEEYDDSSALTDTAKIKKVKELNQLVKKQQQMLKDKDEQMEQMKNAHLQPQLNKKEVKLAMENIIKEEVEQRTKSWIQSQQTSDASAQDSNSQIGAMQMSINMIQKENEQQQSRTQI